MGPSEMVGKNESKLPNLKRRYLVPVKVTSLPANPVLTEKVSFPKANKIEISLHPLSIISAYLCHDLPPPV